MDKEYDDKTTGVIVKRNSDPYVVDQPHSHNLNGALSQCDIPSPFSLSPIAIAIKTTARDI